MDERLEDVRVILARSLSLGLGVHARACSSDEIRECIRWRLDIRWRGLRAWCRPGRLPSTGRATFILAQLVLQFCYSSTQVDILALQLSFSEQADLIRGERGSLGGMWSVHETSPDDCRKASACFWMPTANAVITGNCLVAFDSIAISEVFGEGREESRAHRARNTSAIRLTFALCRRHSCWKHVD